MLKFLTLDECFFVIVMSIVAERVQSKRGRQQKPTPHDISHETDPELNSARCVVHERCDQVVEKSRSLAHTVMIFTAADPANASRQRRLLRGPDWWKADATHLHS